MLSRKRKFMARIIIFKRACFIPYIVIFFWGRRNIFQRTVALLAFNLNCLHKS